MKRGVNCVIVVLALMLSALAWTGCSKKSEPAKDAGKPFPQLTSKAFLPMTGKSASKAKPAPADDIIVKAVDDSGAMKREDGSFTVVPPVKVVEKGKQSRDGSWPVKVKFTITYRMKDGKISSPTETTTSFRIFEEKDAAGKSVWKAKAGT
jgi:hypothetical protein